MVSGFPNVSELYFHDPQISGLAVALVVDLDTNTPELRGLGEMLSQPDGFYRLVKPAFMKSGRENEPTWKTFLRSMKVTFVAAHKNRPHRLIRSASFCGPSTQVLPIGDETPNRQFDDIHICTDPYSTPLDEFQPPIMHARTPNRGCVLDCSLFLITSEYSDAYRLYASIYFRETILR
jgi:hypothetical protein